MKEQSREMRRGSGFAGLGGVCYSFGAMETAKPALNGRRDLATGVVLCLGALGLYMRTLAPSVAFMFDDTLELQYIVPRLGIIHQTGYPLYALLGKLFTLLIPLNDTAFRLNLLSAVVGACAVGMLYLVLRHLLVHRWAAVVGAATFAMGQTFWSQAVIAETYTTQMLIVTGLLYVALIWREEVERGDAGCASKRFYALALLMGKERSREGVRLLSQNNIPNYPFPERAVDALRAMWEYRQWLDRPIEQPPTFDFRDDVIRQTLAAVRADRRTVLVESEARAVAQAIGLAVPQTELARNVDEAVSIASRVGYPVVMKIASPDILHKSDIGGVKVGIANDQDARDAFDLITYRAHRFMPDAQVWGVTVQQMVPQGKEVIIGMSCDPQFGPLLAFGMGGVYVEVLKDVTFRVAPITALEATEMTEEIRGASLLRGVRGEPPSDLEAIRAALLRVSRLVSSYPEIVEMDVNPLVVHRNGAVAIDVRMVIQ